MTDEGGGQPPSTALSQAPIEASSPRNDDEIEGSDTSRRKRIKSPDGEGSVRTQTRELPQQQVTTTPTRSRARQSSRSAHDEEFSRQQQRNTKNRSVWVAGDPVMTKSTADTGDATASQKLSRPLSRKPNNQDEEIEPGPMIRQPETRPISQEQLVAEVKGIYAGLVMVESKCIDVDNSQNAQNDTSPKLNNEQWQALIALHRTLLHEHHDFFLASQHPSASPALRRLASKYAMPARMWRHGIHSFLELLRHRLPQSLEHMLTFIYLAYSMMALLYETVPAFEDTWVECLGDLGRYRMAIEDDDIRDREVWTAVSRHWYTRASDKAPTTYVSTLLLLSILEMLSNGFNNTRYHTKYRRGSITAGYLLDTPIESCNY